MDFQKCTGHILSNKCFSIWECLLECFLTRLRLVLQEILEVISDIIEHWFRFGRMSSDDATDVLLYVARELFASSKYSVR